MSLRLRRLKMMTTRPGEMELNLEGSSSVVLMPVPLLWPVYDWTQLLV